MTTVIFAGPTLRPQDVRGLEAECLPPVQQGDVYRVASRRRPLAIGIVDGVFQHVPSVWHKEILWAMANGIHVFGAASMGALRAAELHSFGMVGVGRIFDAYRSGVLEDDDEVAVIHGPAETGYIALSEAMVNIRATLVEAADAGVISTATRDALVAAAKGTFYQERSYEALLERAPAGVLPEELAKLRDWLPRGRVNLKRNDAIEMIEAMKRFLATEPPPKQVTFDFAHTTLWDNAVLACESEGAAADDPVADELRIGVDNGEEARRAGLWRMLALRECERRGVECTAKEYGQRANEFRRRHGLASAADLGRWLAANGLDHQAFNRLMADEVRLDKLSELLGAAGTPFGLDQLRVANRYVSAAKRAHDKKRALAGMVASTPDQSGLLAAMLWYFEHQLGSEIPDDMEAYARRTGYADAASFGRAVWREYLFCRLL